MSRWGNWPNYYTDYEDGDDSKPPQDVKPPTCKHEPVNYGLNQIKWACSKCNKEFTDWTVKLQYPEAYKKGRELPKSEF